MSDGMYDRFFKNVSVQQWVLDRVMGCEISRDVATIWIEQLLYDIPHFFLRRYDAFSPQ